MRVNTGLLVLIVGLFGGCGTNKTYRISSEPPGASVSSGEVFYGTTPFTTNLNAILPHRAWDGKLWASRVLTFTKEGYLPATAVINEFGEAGAVHVDLSAEEANPKSAEGRLRTLKTLRDQGLVSEEQYEAKRAEILGEL